MQKRSSKEKIEDINSIAADIVKQTTNKPIQKSSQKKSKEKNPNAVALGKLGGLKGGKTRAKTLSPERRKEIAQKAARARWKKYK